MKTKHEIEEGLATFYGVDHYYYKWSILFPRALLTDGTQYLADECGAYWLMDMIGSHLPSLKGEYFAVALLEKKGKGWKFTLVDDVPANKVFAKQSIEYSDFPLDSIKLYVTYDGARYVIQLPSEY